MGQKQINVAVALIFDRQQRVLLVRKRGTDFFQLPGGKIEPGETPTEAAIREIHEEVDLLMGEEQLTFVAEACDRAMVENAMVRAQVFSGEVAGTPMPSAEIEEIIWFDLNCDNKIKLAHLTQNKTLPLAKKILKNKAKPHLSDEFRREILN